MLDLLDKLFGETSFLEKDVYSNLKLKFDSRVKVKVITNLQRFREIVGNESAAKEAVIKVKDLIYYLECGILCKFDKKHVENLYILIKTYNDRLSEYNKEGAFTDMQLLGRSFDTIEDMYDKQINKANRNDDKAILNSKDIRTSKIPRMDPFLEHFIEDRINKVNKTSKRNIDEIYHRDKFKYIEERRAVGELSRKEDLEIIEVPIIDDIDYE